MFSTKKLKYLMAQSNISCTQLARNIGISPTTISEIVNGTRANPRPETIHILAKYFKIDPSHFYDDAIINKLYLESNNENIFFKSLKEALSHLLIKSGVISTSSLNKLSGIPKYTLDRILNEEITQPNPKILQQLAQFFTVTVPQLMGLDPIYTNNQSFKKLIPLINLENLNEWIKGKYLKGLKYVHVPHNYRGDKDNDFAILVTTNEFEPDFKESDILIVYTNAIANWGDFIITSIKNKISIYEFNEKLLRKAGEDNYIEKPLYLPILGLILKSPLSNYTNTK